MSDRAATERDAGWYLSLPYSGVRHLTCNGPDALPEGLQADSIYSGPVLAQSANWRERIAEWQGRLTMVALFLPDCRFVEPQANAVRLCLDDVIDAVRRPDWVMVEADIVDGHAFVVARRATDLQPDGAFVDLRWRKSTRHALVVRTGAHGDGIMASSVLPALKAEGWTISFAANERVFEAIQHDPHVDHWIVLPKRVNGLDHVAWRDAMAPRFDRVVDLQHTVENLLLPTPADGAYHWPADQRRRMFAGSYLAAHHAAAGVVAAPFAARFHPSADERAWAKGHADQLGRFALIALRGSANHKWSPWWPQVVTQLLARTDLQIVLSGAADAKDLEGDCLQAAVDFLGSADRVHSLVDVGSIRRPMALAQLASVVIGPETGVLNAVCLDAVPKVVLLSHSAPSNLTDDWVNATALLPSSPCFPCHRLHHVAGDCPTDAATRSSACALSIGAPEIVAAVIAATAPAARAVPRLPLARRAGGVRSEQIASAQADAGS